MFKHCLKLKFLGFKKMLAKSGISGFKNYCHCRDKATGQCFGLTWFKLKPGPGPYILCKGDCGARREWKVMEDKRKEKKL